MKNNQLNFVNKKTTAASSPMIGGGRAGIRKPAAITPYIEADGGLVIPFGCAPQYCWWAGGQSVTETVEELKNGR